MTTRLETLPPELLYNVLSFLSYDLPTELPLYWEEDHPLSAVAALSPFLRDHIEEHTRNLLFTHTTAVNARKNAASTALDADASAKPSSKLPTCPRTGHTWRKKWLSALKKECWFCRKKSSRRAILDKTMVCCDKCDGRRFPKKIVSQHRCPALL